jgi:chorismate mutase/prephenate dehydratase
LEIRHHLVSKYELKDVKKIYSRRIALAQCKDWIIRNVPKAELIETSSTAKGAEQAGVYLNSAAVASELAAKENGLNIIARNIEDNPNNLTRFLVIGKSKPKSTGTDKTSIVFSVKHEAGALFNALQPLDDLNINMTKIESRPTRMKTWEYVFFIDMEGFVDDEKVKKALEKMKQHCSFVKVLGSYPREERV